MTIFEIEVVTNESSSSLLRKKQINYITSSLGPIEASVFFAAARGDATVPPYVFVTSQIASSFSWTLYAAFLISILRGALL